MIEFHEQHQPDAAQRCADSTFQFGEAGRTSNRFRELGHVWLSDARLDCRHDRVERLRRDYAEALDLYVCDRHIFASRHFAGILGLTSYWARSMDCPLPVSRADITAASVAHSAYSAVPHISCEPTA